MSLTPKRPLILKKIARGLIESAERSVCFNVSGRRVLPAKMEIRALRSS
jgi:hypothetical protein